MITPPGSLQMEKLRSREVISCQISHSHYSNLNPGSAPWSPSCGHPAVLFGALNSTHPPQGPVSVQIKPKSREGRAAFHRLLWSRIQDSGLRHFCLAVESFRAPASPFSLPVSIFIPHPNLASCQQPG